jgi:hypothetical protein
MANPGALNKITNIGRERLEYRLQAAGSAPKRRRLKAVL